MDNKIYVVARSRVQEVDVGDILGTLGGGGHPYAAAATIKNRTLIQVEHQLIEILQERVRSRRSAKDLMSAPPITVDLAIACQEAAKLLTRYNINALLVTQQQNGKQRLRGIISRQVIEKALYHELGHVPVKEYMTTELATVAPDADLEEIQTKIIENQQRLLPVIEGESLVGVVTRTDLLNLLIRQSQRSKTGQRQPAQEHLHARTRNIVKFMRERLSARLMEILRQIGRVATDLGCDAYVVGGFVRDLLLYRANEDLDIVIEGDGIAFARAFAPLVQARVHSHAKFGTAVIIFPDGLKIDIASARMEYYKFPAALPTVEMSSIKLDLFRRDFTINTLAIQLNKEKFGILIDFFSAQKDIKEKVIRVLHNLSFVEDPTRVFRAIRFEQRFAFAIGKLTSGLINNAVKMDFLQRLSGRRVFTEMRLILSEENPTPAIVRLGDYNLLQIIHPALELDNERIGLFNAAKKVLAWHDLLFLEETYMKWSVYFMILLCHRTRQTSAEICQRLEMAPRLCKIFVEERFSAERCLHDLETRLPASNSELFRRLNGFRIELILYMMARTREEKVKKAISRYITKLRTVSIHLRGRELLAMGLEPGPIFRETLQAVFDAKLDGRIKTPADEIAVARKLIASREASST
jgi:tRNA nucleotidyltransferase (CCA-adding enzyme)